MTLHTHHEHCCEHEQVKYCKICKVVYCVKCGKEWRENFWTYTYTYPTYSVPYQTAGSSYKISDISTTTVCNHLQ